MYRITIKDLYCYEQEDYSWIIDLEDDCKLTIAADGRRVGRHDRSMRFGDRWSINTTYEFRDSVTIQLIEEDDFDSDDNLGRHTIRGVDATGLMSLMFTEDDAEYMLTVLIQDDRGMELHEPEYWSMRDNLSQLGPGIVPPNEFQRGVTDKLIYQIGNEMISFQETRNLHRTQDRNRNTGSLLQWMNTHCDFLSGDTVRIDTPGGGEDNAFQELEFWDSVNNENSHTLSGFVRNSKLTDLDNPLNHESMDWNWDVMPSPHYMYMLGSGYATFQNNAIPSMHNEWESASFPLQFRPFPGQFSTVTGRYIWDVAHAPVQAEIHPAHTIINQHTAAASLGRNRELVPVNRAVLGMGACGGFIGTIDRRWQNEFGAVADDFFGDAEDSWPTNLKRHPVKFWFFPPVERPGGAELVFNIRTCKHISVNDREDFNDFLNLCTNDSPYRGGEGLGFRLFNRVSGHEDVDVPDRFKPQFEVIRDAYGQPSHYEVTLDLEHMPDIPVGYYAVLECGWDLPAHHRVQRYRVTFETFDVDKQNDDSRFNDDEWSFFFGVNGKYHAKWYGNGQVDFGENVMDENINGFTVDLIDDQPMVIHDNGHDRDAGLADAGKIDSVYLVLPGRDIFRSIERKGLEIVSSDTGGAINRNTRDVRFKVSGGRGDTDHTWTIRIEKND